jgi:hypothetical protein
MRITRISFWVDDTGIVGIKAAYNHMEGQLIGTMAGDQKDWECDGSDSISSVSVMHGDFQITAIEIISMQRMRFRCGIWDDSSMRSNLPIVNKTEFRQLSGFLKDGKIVGLELEMI